MEKPDEAVKHDAEKIQLELLSSSWLFGVGRVLTFGAKKYAAHNWRKGLHQSRLLGAALRHIVAYLGGEDRDEETGLSHLYHASCCLMFASELAETHPELDDRYTAPKAWRAQESLGQEAACDCHVGCSAMACAKLQCAEVGSPFANVPCDCECHT